MRGTFRPVPSVMSSIIKEFSGGKTQLRIVARLVKQDSTGYDKRGNTNVAGTYTLSAGARKRLREVATKLNTRQSTIVQSLIHAALPKLEEITQPKTCPHCKG